METWSREVYRVNHGKRTILNTDWPIESVVTRERKGTKIYWLATYRICNGTANGSKRFKTKKEAIASL